MDIFKPMLALPTQNSQSGEKKLEKILMGTDYWAEPKIDGHRAVYYNGGIFSRSTGVNGTQREYTKLVDHIVDELRKEDPDKKMIIDGELAFDFVSTSEEITTILGSTQDEETKLRAKGLVYFIFDITRLPTGEDISDWPLRERRKALDAIFTLAHTRYVIPTEVYDPERGYDLRSMLDYAKNSGWEGVMLKNKNSTYIQGSRKANFWYKWKVAGVIDEEVFITRILEPEHFYRNKLGRIDYSRPTRLYSQGLAGSVEVAQYDANGDIFIRAKVGGWTDEQRKDFAERPDYWIGKVFDLTAFRETKDRRYISPRFVRWRDDLDKTDCTMT